MAEDEDQIFYDFYKKHVNKLLNYAMGFLKSREETEEAVQEIFIKYWNNRKRILNEESHEAYLFNIAYNHLITCLKRKVKNAQKTVKLEDSEPAVADSEQTDERLIYEEQLEIVHAIVKSLSPQKQLIYELKCTKEFTNKQIADQLDLSVSMVEKHWRLITHQIKKDLDLSNHG